VFPVFISLWIYKKQIPFQIIITKPLQKVDCPQKVRHLLGAFYV
jgi:hypothetical protein